MQSIDALLRQDIENKKVLFRADLNLPLSKKGAVDITRIRQHQKSIEALIKAGAKIVLLSHFSRPEGFRSRKMSLAQIQRPLEETLNRKVHFVSDCIGDAARWTINHFPAKIFLMENTRFYSSEVSNNPIFTKQLAQLGDFYVNDAFSVSHRAESSTEGLAHLLPAFAGYGLMEELKKLESLMRQPKKPVLAIIGGTKIHDKINMIHNLLETMDVIAIGGAMANMMLAAQNKMSPAAAKADEQTLMRARGVLEKAAYTNCKLLLPEDVVIATELNHNKPQRTIAPHEVPDDMLCLDIGRKSVASICTEIDRAQTIVWNGPLGAYEVPPFHRASMAVAKKIAASDALSVAGGGETSGVIQMSDCAFGFTHISTGGGAFLAWLAGETLPTVAALNQNDAAY